MRLDVNPSYQAGAEEGVEKGASCEKFLEFRVHFPWSCGMSGSFWVGESDWTQAGKPGTCRICRSSSLGVQACQVVGDFLLPNVI